MHPTQVSLSGDTQRDAALSHLDKQRLTVLAAIGVPCNRTQLGQYLREAGVEREPQRARSARRSSQAEPSVVDLILFLQRSTRLGLVLCTETKGSLYACTPEAAHAALADPAARAVLECIRRTWTPAKNSRHSREFTTAGIHRNLQLARLALYLGEPAEVDRLFARAAQSVYDYSSTDAYRTLLDPRSPSAALDLMSPELRQQYLRHITTSGFVYPLVPSLSMLAAAAKLEPQPAPVLRPLAVMLAAIGGDTEQAESWLSGASTAAVLEARAVVALQRGDIASARTLASEAVVKASSGSRKRPLLASPLGPVLALALATGTGEQVALARAVLSGGAHKGRIDAAYRAIANFLGLGATETDRVAGHLDQLCRGLVHVFLGEPLPKFMREGLARLAVSYRAGGAHWLAAQADAISARRAELNTQPPAAAPTSDAVLLALYRPTARWARALAQLESLSPTEAEFPGILSDRRSNASQRLVVLVQLHERELRLGQDGLPASAHERFRYAPQHEDDDDDFDEADFDDDDHDDFDDARSSSGNRAARDSARGSVEIVTETTLGIEPRLQTRRGDTFTSGRAVALRTLADPAADLDYLTAEDQQFVAQICMQRTWHGLEYYLGPRAALGLVGHPRVFWADRPEAPPVEVVTQRPTLKVAHGPNGLRIQIEPFAGPDGIGAMVDADGRLVVCELTPAQLDVQRAVLALPPIPEEGEARVRQLLGRMASLFTIESQVGVDALQGKFEELAADSRPVVQLVRTDPGLRARVSVAPLGPAGPSFKPGEGLHTVATQLDGRRVRCQRELAAECQALAVLLEAAPQLSAALGPAAVRLDDLTECLALLQALSSLGDAVLVQWPEGRPCAVVGDVELSSLRLSIGQNAGWLEATGTLNIDEALVFDMQHVLAQRVGNGAYLALGEDRYVALSRELQQQLSALETAAAVAPPAAAGGALRLPPIALGFVSPWLKLLRAAGGLAADARTAAQLERIERAYETTPELPKTFEAQLRPYQVAGYEFLARLAEIGAGACLADDMGLGKTLMALALLVSRGARGPALVIAPTSVRANWYDEALRFAPTLRMRRLDGPEGVQLDALEAFDVLVCSYTVMTQRIEQLECTRFATLLLDEAQVVKNGATQRAQAARRLVAEARVALTGTPVENHLGDLHSIMHFLNPGLLGSAKAFEARFGKPIQRDRDSQTRDRLRALIAPFLLRRRKAEVLRELPARTEITLRVEPESAEQAFTEALRRAAVARLHAGGEARAESAVSILAEITRLRRAACHPQLIDPGAEVGAAKLERLVELAHELREGGHRALVFSQFVDFLKLVRTRLLAEGFTCQYLDGSTSEPARKKAVTAFQAGEGELFLISLKAGGFGLNLTAADYVIHLDPWWNPAVEAQASDRAHRIGQERPVTIYRLVNVASIEERVLALHDRKQALAEELLRDSAEATRLDPQALMALLEN